MKNSRISNRLVVIGCVALGVTLLLAMPFIWRYQLSSTVNRREKWVEISQSQITGYKGTQKSWQIVASTIWSGQSRYLIHAEKIFSGRVFDDNEAVVLDHLSGDSIQINTQNKFFWGKNIEADLMGRSQKMSGSGLLASADLKKPIKIISEELRYFSANKKTFLSGKVIIKQGKAVIYPKEGVEVDHDKNIATIKNGFRLEANDMIVTGNTMTIYIDEDRSEIPDGVSGTRPANPTTNEKIDARERQLRAKTTWFRANALGYYTPDSGEIVTLSGNVVIKQDDKLIQAGFARYEDTADTIHFWDHVKVNGSDLVWLLTPQRLKALKSAEIKKALHLAFSLACDDLVLDKQGKVMTALGAVKFTQPDKTATCSKLVLDDAKNTLSLVGDVSMVKDKTDKLRCDQLIIDLDKEEFNAKQGVETEFILKKKKP